MGRFHVDPLLELLIAIVVATVLVGAAAVVWEMNAPPCLRYEKQIVPVTTYIQAGTVLVPVVHIMHVDVCVQREGDE